LTAPHRRGWATPARLIGLVLIAVVVVLRLAFEATAGAIALRSYAAVTIVVAVGVAALVAVVAGDLPRIPERGPRRRFRRIPVGSQRHAYLVKARRSRGKSTVYLN
jgi:hypothetical protein